MSSYPSPLNGLRLDDVLHLNARHTTRIVGHLLRSIYAPIIEERTPDALESVLLRLSEPGVRIGRAMSEPVEPGPRPARNPSPGRK